MSLSVIFGKPGAGKSYFAVQKIAEYLVDFCRYEITNGVEHERKIYTNLPLKFDAIDDYISDRLGKDVKASKYIVTLNDDFFVQKSESGVLKKIDWWVKIPDGALIIIDEVQHYLSSSKDEGGAYLKDFQLYISTHRHHQHDLIFLTQHTDNINKVCLNMAADAYHVINIKGRVIPFLGIPFADLDVVKEAFGYNQQYANILYGNYIGRAFKPESTLHILLKPEIYALYKSHNTAEATDRPSLKLSKVGAIMWFLRRHFLGLFARAVLVWLIFYMTWNVICKLPLTLSNKLTEEISSNQKLAVNKLPSVKKNTASKLPENSKNPSKIPPINNSSAKLPEKKESTPPKVDIITPDYVKINGRRLKVGDTFTHEGKKYELQKLDFASLTVDFGLCSSADSNGQSQPADSTASGQGI